MTNREKSDLRKLARDGYSFKEIKSIGVDCCDATIKRYIKTFNPKKANRKEHLRDEQR